MKTRSTLLFLSLLIMSHSCTTKYVPDKELEIDSTFLSVFKSISNNKLLVFKDKNNNRVTYKISKIDSVIRNKKGWFINSAPNKELKVTISEIYEGRTVLNEYYNECVVTREPFENKSYFIVNFNNIQYINDSLPELKKDTITITGSKFTNYYLFESSIEPENKNEIKELYISPKDGIIAYKMFSDEFWKRDFGVSTTDSVP